MKLRHNFAAHSGADKFEDAVIALVLPPIKVSSVDPQIVRELKQLDLVDLGDQDVTFESLITHAQDFALRKIDTIGQKIVSDEIIPRGLDYWYAK
jgi:hypothetical protein